MSSTWMNDGGRGPFESTEQPDDHVAVRSGCRRWTGLEITGHSQGTAATPLVVEETSDGAV